MTPTRQRWFRRAEVTLWVMVAGALAFRALPPREVGRAPVDAFVGQNGIRYPVAMADGDVQLSYGGVDALPQSFLVDRQGRVRRMVSGVFSEGALRKAVDELLAEGAS